VETVAEAAIARNMKLDMNCLGRHASNERGGTLVLLAAFMTVAISMAALSIDLGMLYNAHSEA
jgi:hypothetical protein